MHRKAAILLSLIVLILTAASQAQSWTPILASDRAIDWSNAGVGDIPARAVNCATLASSATVAQINAALSACPGGQTVFLSAGSYTISGSINIPSNVTLRGAGANLTILNATGKNASAVIQMGTGSVSFAPVSITSGAVNGSTHIMVANASTILAGKYLAISEQNNSSYVSASGSEGNCNWCDGGWSHTGSYARGQIVAVTAVLGDNVTISPALYGSYTNQPIAVPFAMSASYAGVEDLQVVAHNTGYGTNFGLSACAYCWVKGVESNYADGDHVEVYWGYRDEIRDSYFSNAFLHTPGTHDSDLQIALKTSASLIENNIIERTHVAVMLEWGAAGNVLAYNYTMGEFDNGSTNVVIGGVDFHGAHPQFNLIEGNVLTQIDADSVWGTSSHTTAFRNWVVGTSRICSPMSGRGVVSCSGTNGHYGFQAARAMQFSYLATRNNFIANVVGSAPMQALIGYNWPMAQKPSIKFPALRSYDATAYAWSFGYGEASDNGSGTGCNGGTLPCHRASTAASDLFHGNFNNVDSSITWTASISHTLPASFYLTAKPHWWGSLPFPSTGPDVASGTGPKGHSYGNPARVCYLNGMGGSDGGAGGPLSFNAAKCYGAGSQTTPSMDVDSK
jgi:hypothetical protein